MGLHAAIAARLRGMAKHRQCLAEIKAGHYNPVSEGGIGWHRHMWRILHTEVRHLSTIKRER